MLALASRPSVTITFLAISADNCNKCYAMSEAYNLSLIKVWVNIDYCTVIAIGNSSLKKIN